MTAFVETELLLAVGLGDHAEADRLVRSMLPGERLRLINDANRMIDLLNQTELSGPLFIGELEGTW